MNFLKRAYLYLVRKKVKTLFLFITLLIIATMLLTCISIQTAANNGVVNIKKSLRSYFTINAKQLPEGLNEKILKNILSIDGVNGEYILRSYTKAIYLDNNKNLLKIKTEGAATIPLGCENAGKIIGSSNSEKDSYFIEGGFKVIEGNHITLDQKNVILLHRDFAYKNGISLGDTIVIKNLENPELHVEVIVQGLFMNTREQNVGMTPSYDLYENVAFTDIVTSSKLIFGKLNNVFQYGDIYVDNPEQLDNIINNVEAISGVQWEKCILTKYDQGYQNTKRALETLQNIVFATMIVVMIVSFIILVLILTFSVRNRMHEIGVLLSIGMSKSAIVLQQLVEIFIITVFALVISYMTSFLLAEQVGNSLLAKTTKEYRVVEQKNNNNAVIEKDSELEKEVRMSHIEVTISELDYLVVWIVGMALCSITTVFAMIPIIKMKPKNILSQMS
ncbi:FtsX-like permease family protein [Petralouisia muris]|uniref:FtsX-like permease family protein n=1 Tax=Petralouisia muris TaxID=3032872 RepID=A0AC61RQ23_9FIRM|nr:FtsX-like permease family protein [Petralouisia muris]TGY91109.1 FtsX-like permease family protein [Petralouisia muris]